MKKLILIILAMVMVLSLSSSLAEVDLTELSFDELVALEKNVSREIMSRPEWKEVEVPAGEYTIGVDIPAGWYSMRVPEDDWKGIYLRWYPDPNSNYWDYVHTDFIGKFELKEGWRIYLEQKTIFAPPASLGF